MELSGSGIKEMSSSNIGKSYAGGKEGFNFGSLHSGMELKEPKITFSDIDSAIKETCFESARIAYMALIKGELPYFKQMAEQIKNELDEKHGKSWHVVVGRDFGAFMGYEDRKIIMFWINKLGFLIWKHG